MPKCLICQTNEATMGTEEHGAYLCAACVQKAEDALCPQCGRKVFIPKIGFIKDGCQVLCSDMGHWTGKLSDCIEPRLDSDDDGEPD